MNGMAEPMSFIGVQVTAAPGADTKNMKDKKGVVEIGKVE